MVLSLTAATSLSAGFYAGKRWEQGASAKVLKQQLVALNEQAKAAVNTLNEQWQDKFAATQLELDQWKEQANSDQEIIKAMVRRNFELQRTYDDLYTDFHTIPDFGSCRLSDDAISLLLNTSSFRGDSSAVPGGDN